MPRQPVKTTRQPSGLSPEELMRRAVEKASRDEAGLQMYKSERMNHLAKLCRVMLLEVRDHYVTLPHTVRVALEEFFNQ